MAKKVGFGKRNLVVTDRHARGLVRQFLDEERQRAREVKRRRMRTPLQGAPSLRASYKVLEQFDRAWAPLSLAAYSDTAPDGAARLGVIYLETDKSSLAEWPGLVARSRMQRYMIRLDDGAYRSEVAGFAAFTHHCLERVIQRGLHWRRATCELAVAAIVANSKLHEVASANEFRRIIVPGHSGLFVGDFSPDMPFLRFDTFLAIGAAGRRHCDLLIELAGLLWTENQYRDLLPALFYPDEPNPLMDAVLRAFEKHRRMLQREHAPREDWFGRAVALKDREPCSRVMDVTTC